MSGTPVLPEGVHAPYMLPGTPLTPRNLEQQERRMVEMLEEIMEKAREFRVTIRALGSIAFRIKCPGHKHLEYLNRRYLTDIDFVARSREIPGIQDMFFDMGWTENQTVLRLFGHRRRIFHHPEIPLHSDVFLDKLRFCHEIDFRKRLELDSPTVSVTDLLLEKLQIVEINRKDLVDIMVLLCEYSISDDGSETACLDGRYIARLLSGDWGWWRTATENLRKTMDFASDYLSGEDSATVRKRTDRILELVNGRSRSLKWKLRSLIGDRLKWYNEVEEVDRD